MKKIIFIINKKYVIYAKKSFLIDKNDKNYINKKKVRDHEHYTGKSREAAYSICNLNYNDQKEISIIIHSITYDTHFILNQLAIKIKGELNCLGDDMEKYITFSVPIKKEVNNYDGNGSKKKTITFKLKFIDSFRFMPHSLSNLVDNTFGIFNSIECKSCLEKIKIDSECYVGLKNNGLIYKCKKCKKEWKRPLNKSIESFPSIYQFCKSDLDEFVLSLRKGVYPYMDSWEKFN